MRSTRSIPSILHTALDGSLNFVYPPICQICRAERAGAEAGYVGPACWADVRFVQAPFCNRCGLPFEGEMSHPFQCANCQDLELHFRSARSAVVANALLMDVIHRYKYTRSVWFEPFLAGLLLAKALPVLAAEKWDFIVPVPLFSVKKREREFNQAELLAARLATAAKIALNKQLLIRVKPTLTQTRLDRRQRAANMELAFAYAGKKRLQGEKIVLVDDILTTGATTNACAKVLRKAGAGEICVWTVARRTLDGLTGRP